MLCLDSFPSIIPPDFENNTPKGNVESISATELLQLPGKIPLPIKGEDWLKRYLLKKGYSLPLSIWLSKNIREKENSGEYEWKFNIKELPSVSYFICILLLLRSNVVKFNRFMNHIQIYVCGILYNILLKVVLLIS